MKRTEGSSGQRARGVGVATGLPPEHPNCRSMLPPQWDLLGQTPAGAFVFTNGSEQVEVDVPVGEGFTVGDAQPPLQRASARWGCQARVVQGG